MKAEKVTTGGEIGTLHQEKKIKKPSPYEFREGPSEHQ